MVMNHYVILFCSWSAFIGAKIRHHESLHIFLPQSQDQYKLKESIIGVICCLHFIDD